MASAPRCSPPMSNGSPCAAWPMKSSLSSALIAGRSPAANARYNALAVDTTSPRVSTLMSGHVPDDRLDDRRRLVRPLDFDRRRQGRLNAARELGDAGDPRQGAQSRADRYRCDEPNPVEAVVDCHRDAIDAIEVVHEVR